MKKLVFMICLVLSVLASSVALAGSDIMVWTPRTPAGGGYVPDPAFWEREALLSQYGERVVQFFAPPVTNQTFNAGQILFGGNTNFVTGGIDQQNTVGTNFNAQSGNVGVSIQK